MFNDVSYLLLVAIQYILIHLMNYYYIVVELNQKLLTMIHILQIADNSFVQYYIHIH